MLIPNDAEEFRSLVPTGGRRPPPSLITDTGEFLARLRELLELDEGGPHAHLSFSGIPESLTRALGLLERAAGGDAGAYQGLARWMAELDALDAALEALHAAGAISAQVLRACRALTNEHGWLVKGWAWAGRPR